MQTEQLKPLKKQIGTASNMSWVQVKSPNLNVQTSIGMCLKYVQDAYGSGWAGSYALQGWRDIVKKKHTNRNIPGGVYVPIWFEGYWNGVNYGHVAIYKDGVCWSSPYTNKRSHDRLGSIQEVERIYGMKYIGWSEDIGGTTVIKKGGDMPITKEQENELSILATGSYPGKDYNYKFTGTTNYNGFYQHWAGVSRSHGLIKKTTAQEKQIKELEAQKKDGFVEVTEKLYRKVGK